MPIQPKQQPPYYEPGTGGTSAPLIYTAIMNQTGTNAPVATIQHNTIGTIIWTRLDVGDYEGTLTGVFTANKTWPIISGLDGLTAKITRVSADAISIQTFDSTPAFADGCLVGTAIRIEVYP